MLPIWWEDAQEEALLTKARKAGKWVPFPQATIFTSLSWETNFWVNWELRSEGWISSQAGGNFIQKKCFSLSSQWWTVRLQAWRKSCPGHCFYETQNKQNETKPKQLSVFQMLPAAQSRLPRSTLLWLEPNDREAYLLPLCTCFRLQPLEYCLNTRPGATSSSRDTRMQITSCFPGHDGGGHMGNTGWSEIRPLVWQREASRRGQSMAHAIWRRGHSSSVQVTVNLATQLQHAKPVGERYRQVWSSPEVYRAESRAEGLQGRPAARIGSETKESTALCPQSLKGQAVKVFINTLHF